MQFGRGIYPLLTPSKLPLNMSPGIDWPMPQTVHSPNHADIMKIKPRRPASSASRVLSHLLNHCL